MLVQTTGKELTELENIISKTFPIRTTNLWLDEVKKAADKENKSMQEFVQEAVEAKVKKSLGE